MLKVRIAELNRSALRLSGSNFLGVDPRTGAIVGSQIAGSVGASGVVAPGLFQRTQTPGYLLGAANAEISPLTRSRRLVVEALESRRLLAVGIREFPIPTANSAPLWITAGPDTALYFTAAPNPSIPGFSVTFTATVATASGTPTGTITSQSMAWPKPLSPSPGAWGVGRGRAQPPTARRPPVADPRLVPKPRPRLAGKLQQIRPSRHRITDPTIPRVKAVGEVASC